MRRGGRILVILGLLLGAITAVGTFLVISTAGDQGRQVPTKKVVVAIQPITDRSIIGPDAVGIQDWPEAALPPGMLAFEKTDAVIGMLAIQPIYPGQIILPPMIVDKKIAGEIGTRSNAAFVIPEGKVAMAFGISEISGVGNALQPGDYVDMLLTLSAEIPACPPAKPCTGLEGLPVTQLMLQNVLILQVGTWARGEGSQAAAQASILTFALDRQDALTLKAAREQGQIDLILRRAGDTKIVDAPEPVTLQYLNKRFKFNLTPSQTSLGR